MKHLLAAALVAALTSPVLAQTKNPTPPKPTPKGSAGGVSVQSGTGTGTGAVASPPPGAKPAEAQDIRLFPEKDEDAYELERLGDGAYKKGELKLARQFYERSWKAVELPTGAYNMACIDAKEGNLDLAFQNLEKALDAGFDDERILMGDPDMASLRGKPKFDEMVKRARKNREDGAQAVVKEGLYLPPPSPRTSKGILLLLHDASSDPVTVSGPFLREAHGRSLFVAVPRGPAKAGRKRFGWGSGERAFAAVDAALAEAKRRAGDVPVIVLGLVRGGTLAFTVASKRPGVFAAVGSIGGAYDPGGPAEGMAILQSLKGSRLFLGISRDAPMDLTASFKRGRDALKAMGLSPTYTEWVGTGRGLPNDVPAAVTETLTSLTGVGSAPVEPAPAAAAPATGGLFNTPKKKS